MDVIPEYEPTPEDVGPESSAGEASETATNAAETMEQAQNSYTENQTAATEQVLQEAAQKAEIADADAIREGVSTVDSAEPLTEAEAQQLTADINAVQNLPAASDVLDHVNNATPEELANMKKAAAYTKGMGNAVGEKLSNMASSSAAELEPLNDQMKNLGEKLNEAVKAGDKASVDELSSQIDEVSKNMDEVLKKNKTLMEELEAKSGKGSSKLKSLLKYWKLLAGLGTIAGIFILLQKVSKELTGCYKFSGTDSEKIPCPTDGATCGCGDATKDVTDPTVITNTICNQAAYKQYPFCCAAASPNIPTCSSGVPGMKGVIYYGWKLVTPASIVAGLPKGLDDLGDDIKNFTIKLAKILGIGLGIVVVLYVLFIIGQFLVAKQVKKKVLK